MSYIIRKCADIPHIFKNDVLHTASAVSWFPSTVVFHHILHGTWWFKLKKGAFSSLIVVLMDGTSSKRQLEETEASVEESKKLKSAPKSIEWNSDSTKLAERISKSPEISVGVCQNYVASGWENLLPWAEQLCAKDDAAQDELLYWETYLAKPDESVKEQFSRQLKEDVRNMYDQLLEAGCTNDEATAVTNSDAAESLCDLILHLLDLMPPNSDGQKRFFALQIDVNQQGCIKFHDGRRFTSTRIQVPLHGSGPVLAASEDVDRRFWEAEGGLLSLEEDGEDVDFSVVEEWNQKICKSEISTPPGASKNTV